MADGVAAGLVVAAAMQPGEGHCTAQGGADSRPESEASSGAGATAAGPPPMSEHWPFGRGSFVWLDLELTGLDLRKATIVEIAVVVTDKCCSRRLTGPSLVIRTDPATLDDWPRETFTRNGLLEELEASNVTEAEAEEEVLCFLKRTVPPHSCYLAGSSVHVDAAFLRMRMPRITDYLHYRIVDVSTLLTTARSWCPQAVAKNDQAVYAQKGDVSNAHRALNDLECSISSLKAIKKIFFDPRAGGGW